MRTNPHVLRHRCRWLEGGDEFRYAGERYAVEANDRRRGILRAFPVVRGPVIMRTGPLRVFPYARPRQ